MKKFLGIVLMAAAALPLIASAQSAIDGTWRADLKSISGSDKPSKYLVKDGVYQCETCTPAIKVPADGNEQPLQGNPFFDALAVKIVDDHTIELTSTRHGKVATQSKITIAPDGNSMTRQFTSNDAKGFTNTSTTKMTRVGPAPKGAHAISGSWKLTAVDKMTDNGVVFKTANGTVTMYATDGSSYEAKLDGSKAAFKDSPGNTSVSVRMKDKDTFEETDWRGDKAWFVTTITVAADRKTANVTWENKLNSSHGSYKLNRQ